MAATYYPEIFNTGNMKSAKGIILTDEGPSADTDTRWALETPYVMELVSQAFGLRSDMLVLDYGCGIGRMAKAMIDASGCSVIGVDISPNMRVLAGDYVRSDRFLAVSPGQFDILVAGGLRVNAAIAVWVLQHCLVPSDDITRIQRGLVPGGDAFVLNMPKRAIPAVVENQQTESKHFIWANDEIDVAALLRAVFHVEAEGEPDKSRAPNMGDVGAFWMNLRQRP
jgi:ubiquinone/menaquinone biosynthesis C-methylase UbiE